MRLQELALRCLEEPPRTLRALGLSERAGVYACWSDDRCALARVGSRTEAEQLAAQLGDVAGCLALATGAP